MVAIRNNGGPFGSCRFIGFLLALAFTVLLPGDPLISIRADERKPPLAAGMTYGEVLKLWGAPSDKDEQEIKRRDIWHYGRSRVVFDEGVVSSWSVPGQLYDVVAVPAVPAAQKGKVSRRESDKVSDEVVEEILSEIMKDPAADDKSSPPAPPANIIRPSEVVSESGATN